MSFVNMKWGSDTIIKFFNQYIRYPCLWDVNCVDYRAKSKRYRALQDIVITMDIEGLNVDLLKGKIHSLRNAYLNELRKVRKSKLRISRAEDVYTPRLPWFKVADSFLRGVIGKREAHSNSVPEKSVDRTFPNEECGADVEHSSVAYPYVVTSWSQRNDTIMEEPRHKDCDHMDDAVKDSREVFPSASQVNELEAFGKSVAAQMKNLPEEYAIQLIAEIQTLITKKRLKAIADKRSLSSHALSVTAKQSIS